MTVTPGSILTTQGAADVAASISGVPLTLTHLAFGDANGVAYTPTGAETALRHEVVRIAVDSVMHDPEHPDQVIVTATIPATQAAFTVREIGVYNASGNLEAICPSSNYKPGPTDSVPADYTYRVALVVGATANVVVNLDGAVLASRDWVVNSQDFFAVVSATTAAPPGAPAVYDQYLVPAGATGAWAGHAGQIAVWRGVTYGWLFVIPPSGAEADADDTGLKWRKRAGAWSIYAATHAMPGLTRLATSAEDFNGTIDDAAVTPAGLAAARQTGAHVFGNDVGAANAIQLNLTPALAAYVVGMPIAFKTAVTNTGAVKVKVNALAQVDLVNADGSALRPRTIVAGRLSTAIFDGTAFQLTSPPTGAPDRASQYFKELC